MLLAVPEPRPRGMCASRAHACADDVRGLLLTYAHRVG